MRAIVGDFGVPEKGNLGIEVGVFAGQGYKRESGNGTE